VLVSWAERELDVPMDAGRCAARRHPGPHLGTTSTELTIANVAPTDAGAVQPRRRHPLRHHHHRQAILTVNGTTPCPADFNQDGGVDRADVEVFMLAWEAGTPDADAQPRWRHRRLPMSKSSSSQWAAGGC
jgi:hypothetical protein